MGIYNGHLSSSFSNTAWVSGASYAAGDVVLFDTILYTCIAAHTGSTSFMTDLNLSRWRAALTQVPNLVNYIANSGAESSTTGWATYADAAAASPVDGTGGSPVVTWTRSSSTPLSGTGEFQLTKDAANRQGNGASFDFTIPRSAQAQVLTINFNYAVRSGTYADGDITIWIYDVTNGTLIQPAGTSILNAATNLAVKKNQVTFQTASNSTSYRLIFHCSSVSALAYVVAFDDIYVGPQSMSNGTIITDWVSYTPSTAGLGTPTISDARWRRDGDTLFVSARITAGTTTASTMTVGLPTGLTIDSTWNSIVKVVGNATRQSSSPSNFSVLADNTDSANFRFGNTLSVAGGSTLLVTSEVFSFVAAVKISGWSSNTVVSSDTDTRIVAASYGSSAGQSIPNNTNTTVVFATKNLDTHNGMNTSTGVYTIQVPGTYRVYSSVMHTNNATGARRLLIQQSGSNKAYVEALPNASTNFSQVASCVIQAVAGDTLQVQVFQNSGGALSLITDATAVTFTIERLGGPSQIAASESVQCKYAGTPTGSISSTYSGSGNVVYPTKSFDSHTAYSSGTYTIPVSGKYAINAQFEITGTYALNGYLGISIYKNGSQVSENKTQSGGALTSCRVNITDLIDCIAGDTILIRPATSATGAAYGTGTSINFVTFSRVGN